MAQNRYDRRLNKTVRCIEQGLYRQAVETAAGAIEILLGDLFDELLKNVSPQDAKTLSTTRKNKPLDFANKTLGRKIDIYDHKGIFNRLQLVFGYELRFFNVDFLKTVCALRNECVHDDLQPASLLAEFIHQSLEILLVETERHPQLSGRLSSLSKTLMTALPDHKLIERADEVARLRATSGDQLIVGDSGIGKSALLAHFVDQEQDAWFVVGKDIGTLADSIDDKQPKIVVLDDAHTDVGFLGELIQLRNVKNHGYRIVASSWPEGGQEIKSLLNVAEDGAFELRSLTQDGILQVVNEIGIEGTNWLVHEIVRQAMGLPGLAVNLTNLALRGNIEEIRSGEALSNVILQPYGEQIDRRTRGILACFALGGNSGMHRDTIANILRIPPLDLHDMLSALMGSGIISDVPNVLDHFRLRPEALRHALVREIFFASRAVLSNSILEDLLDAAPNLTRTITELIGAKARGGNVPRRLLEKNLEELLSTQGAWERDVLVSSLFSLSGTVTGAWREYAWLGSTEATWVIENFDGTISLLAQPLLEHIPQRAIPKLLTEAIGDDRELHSHPYHPLRLLQDWVKSAHPLTPEPIYRRKELLRGAKQWLQAGKDSAIGYKAILFAMIPHYAAMIPKPGSGNASTWYAGFLTGPDLHDMASAWKEIIDCTKVIEVPDWQGFLSIIGDWAYPLHGQGPPEEARELMISFAIEMAMDVKEAAGNQRGVLRSLKSLMQRGYPELDIVEDDVLDTLYPIRTNESDWKTQEENWTRSVDELANRWIHREPSAIIAELESLELKTSQHWPRLTPYLSLTLARKISDPLLWFYAMLPRTLPSDIVMPFLQEAINRNVTGWDQALRDSFEIERLRDTAIQIILTGADVPNDLRQSALNIAGQYIFTIERLIWSNQLSQELVMELLKHADKSLVGKVAIAEWQRKETKTVEDDISPLWEQAVIEHCEGDYWLREIFKVEPKLALRWFKHRFVGNSFDPPFEFTSDLGEVFAAWSLQDRRHLLAIVPHGYRFNEIIIQLIGDNLELYKQLLKKSAWPESTLLAPLHRDINAVWESFASLAHEYGHTPEEIVSHTFMATGIVASWVGNYSDVWKSWRDQFEAIRDHEDEVIRRIAEIGYRRSAERYHEELDRERDQDVYGRDWD